MRRLAALVAGVLLAGGATQAFGFFPDEEARRRVEDLRKETRAAQQAVEERLRLIDERMKALDTEVRDRRVVLDLAAQIDALRREVAAMRGSVEVLANRAETTDKRQRELYADIDARLRKLEQAGEAKPADKPKPDPAAIPAAEAQVYEAALNQFKVGNYPLAVAAFQTFLATYPQSRLAPAAQYWLGNSHFAQRDHKNAIAAQQKLLTTWPEDARAPDAMLAIASSQEATGDRRGAQRTLEGLIARFPQSPAAAGAKQRLAPPAPAVPGKPADAKK